MQEVHGGLEDISGCQASYLKPDIHNIPFHVHTPISEVHMYNSGMIDYNYNSVAIE